MKQNISLVDPEEEVVKAIRHLSDEDVKMALSVQATLRHSLSSSLRNRGFLEIPPVMVSPLTDPLNHPVSDPRISCYGGEMWLTKSMIFHKQIAVQKLGRIYIMSPNIRLETSDKAETGRHLYEFTQVDVEALEWTRDQSMDLAENLIIEAIRAVREENRKEMEAFGRDISDFRKGFRRISYLDASREYGDEFEKSLSADAKEPVWLVDIPLQAREFYDREREDTPGILMDMDLIWPEGFQEALSGGEREYDYGRILERISKKGQNPETFKWFLAAAKHGMKGSSGFGIGVERFTRYLCGLKHAGMATAFPKIPGRISL
ncbi:MAG: asparagine synthetase A [Thermoplasmataceae archaeon]